MVIGGSKGSQNRIRLNTDHSVGSLMRTMSTLHLPARKLVFSGLIVLLMVVGAVTAATNGSLAEQEPRGIPLDFEHKTLYLYGDDGGGSGTPDTWDAWNHADQSDADSDSSFSESNGFGQPNNGGGNRAFTFGGSAPHAEIQLINPDLPIYANITLNIFCLNDASCTNKNLRATLLVGNIEYDSETIATPNEENGKYEFEFFSSLDKLEPGEVISLRLEFAKPSATGDGYTLDLGRDNSEMFVEVLEPEEVIIPTDPNGTLDYVSPYANKINQFTRKSVAQTTLTSPIFWGIISLVAIIPMGMFIPSIPLKPVGIALLSVSLLISLGISPVLGIMDQPGEIDIGSPGAAEFSAPSDVVKLDAITGEFLSGLTAGSEMKLFVEYNQFHAITTDASIGIDGQSTPRSAEVIGLGFEKYGEDISSVEATQKGVERLQVYLSLIAVSKDYDLTKGQGLIINITFVKQCTSCAEVVPSWAALTDDGQLADGVMSTILGDGTPRYIIPASAITVTNIEPSWGQIPMMTGMPLALLCFGYGGWRYWQVRQDLMLETYAEDEDWDDDEFEEDEEDEVFDEDEEDLDDDFDFDDL